MDTLLMKTVIFFGVIFFIFGGLILWDKIEDIRERKLKLKLKTKIK